MHLFHLFFAPGGRLGAGCFAGAVILAYALWLAAHLLTVPAVLARAGLWPFVLVQALLIWVWFALHAKRLRDAGRGVGPAQGIAVIYTLAVALLVLVAAFFLDGGAASGASVPASALVLRQLFDTLRTSLDPFIVLALIACASLVIVPIFSVWAAMQPSRAADTA